LSWQSPGVRQTHLNTCKKFDKLNFMQQKI
jgi:hypothetical protein